MTTEQKKRFTVISNSNMEEKSENKKLYQTNPMAEKLMKFKEKEKFSVQDLLKW